jgi:hypothetical protein
MGKSIRFSVGRGQFASLSEQLNEHCGSDRKYLTVLPGSHNSHRQIE